MLGNMPLRLSKDDIRMAAMALLGFMALIGLVGAVALIAWPFKTYDRYGTFNVFAIERLSSGDRVELANRRTQIKEERAAREFEAEVDAYIAENLKIDDAAKIIRVHDRYYYPHDMTNRLEVHNKLVRDTALRRIHGQYRLEPLGWACQSSCSTLQYRLLGTPQPAAKGAVSHCARAIWSFVLRLLI